MTFLEKLERKFGSLAIHNIAIYIVVGQIAVWFLALTTVGPDGASPLLELMVFDSRLVLEGEIWRIFAFPFFPPRVGNGLFLFFAWYIFYMITRALEAQWGAFRLNVYLILGAFLGIFVGFIMPGFPITNIIWGQTAFLAFAYLFPDFEFRLFFILPVKVRWLGWIMWVILGLTFIDGPWQLKIFIAASVSNYFLFFGKDIVLNAKNKKRVANMKAEKVKHKAEAFHVCSECGATDKSHPDRDFRYRDNACLCDSCNSALNPSESSAREDA
jgi:hypothetical protein